MQRICNWLHIYSRSHIHLADGRLRGRVSTPSSAGVICAFLSYLAGLLATAAAPLPKITPTEVVATAPASAWRTIPAEDLLVMTLDGGARVVIQLAPAFAPVHVANIRKFAAANYWHGAAVYRVQDNYVAQWGINEAKRALSAGAVAKPPAEYVRSARGLAITPLGSPDPYARSAGFWRGWPVALYSDGTASLTHCYGTVGVGRDMHPDTGTGGELYAIIGHATRQLDRNIAIVGRVVSGIEHLSRFAARDRDDGLLQGRPRRQADRRHDPRLGAARRASARRSNISTPPARPSRATCRYEKTATTISIALRLAGSICATSRCRSGRHPDVELQA